MQFHACEVSPPPLRGCKKPLRACAFKTYTRSTMGRWVRQIRADCSGSTERPAFSLPLLLRMLTGEGPWKRSLAGMTEHSTQFWAMSAHQIGPIKPPQGSCDWCYLVSQDSTVTSPQVFPLSLILVTRPRSWPLGPPNESLSASLDLKTFQNTTGEHGGKGNLPISGGPERYIEETKSEIKIPGCCSTFRC